MRGRRYSDVDDPYAPQEYMDVGGFRHVNCGPDGWRWEATTPNGLIGRLAARDVEEHSDGTISVASILVEQPLSDDTWRGCLERGVWRRR